MKLSGLCPKCGSTEIIADAKVVDRGHANAQRDMILVTLRHPDALILKYPQRTTVSAWVCAARGYVELYADSPTDIQQAPQ